MTNIYWKSPGGTIHTIPEGSTVYAVGNYQMGEMWIDEYDSPESKVLSIAESTEQDVSADAKYCPKCKGELLSPSAEGGGRLRYCARDGCETLFYTTVFLT